MKCLIEYSKSCEFPIENLPYGVFSTPNNLKHRIGVAIGDQILDLSIISFLFDGPELHHKQDVFKETTLNGFMSLGVKAWKEARQKIQSLLSSNDSILVKDEKLRLCSFVPQAEVTMHLPAIIGDYTDFSSSMYHNINCGIIALNRHDEPLHENWKYVPIAYHGRASSIVISGTPIIRPQGQGISPGDAIGTYGPCKALDFELEVAAFVGGPPTTLGKPIEIDDAQNHVFGFILMNDWSARDLLKWEFVPLGPFASKNFATTISPWVVTTFALEPFIVDNFPHDPISFPYLHHNDNFNFDIKLKVDIIPKDSKIPTTVCKNNYRYLYWTIKQQVVQSTSSGCNINPGDLIGSGTISGPTPDSLGSLLESSWGGTKPLSLLDGTQRTFLEDGDTVVMKALCEGKTYNIGFGSCLGTVLPCYSGNKQ